MSWKFIANNRPSRFYPHSYGIIFSYAEVDGSCVLKTETSWKKINGICWYTPNSNYWFLFRRTGC